jgi:hypothetical protein
MIYHFKKNHSPEEYKNKTSAFSNIIGPHAFEPNIPVLISNYNRTANKLEPKILPVLKKFPSFSLLKNHRAKLQSNGSQYIKKKSCQSSTNQIILTPCKDIEMLPNKMAALDLHVNQQKSKNLYKQIVKNFSNNSTFRLPSSVPESDSINTNRVSTHPRTPVKIGSLERISMNIRSTMTSSPLIIIHVEGVLIAQNYTMASSKSQKSKTFFIRPSTAIT